MIEPMGTVSAGLFALAGGIASSRPREVPPDRGPDPARQPAAAKPGKPGPAPAAAAATAPAPVAPTPRTPTLPSTEIGHAIAGTFTLDALKAAHTQLIGAYTTGKISHREYMAGSSQVLPARARIQGSNKMLANTTSQGQLAQHRATIHNAQTPDALLSATQALWNDPKLSAEHRTVANLELNQRRSDVTNLALQQNVKVQRSAVPQGRSANPAYAPLYPGREPVSSLPSAPNRAPRARKSKPAEVAMPIIPVAANTLPRARRSRG